jgi:hypothetical protein
MGFQRVTKPIALTFDEDHELHGLEVTLKTPSLGEFMELADQAGKVESIEDAEKGFRRLADFIVSWNLEDEAGEPIKPSYEALVAQDAAFTRLLVDAFMASVGTVSRPLPLGSNDGDNPIVASLPMEPL